LFCKYKKLLEIVYKKITVAADAAFGICVLPGFYHNIAADAAFGIVCIVSEKSRFFWLN